MNDANEAARAVAQLWRVVHSDMPPGLRTRSDVRQLDSCARELQAALRPPPLDDAIRTERSAVIAAKLAELGGPQQPWKSRKVVLEGEGE